MDIEEFIEHQKTYKVGQVSSSKAKASDLTMTQRSWLNVLTNDPYISVHLINDAESKEEAKEVIKLIDMIIEDRVQNIAITEEVKEDAKTVRKNKLVPKIKEQ